MRAYRCYLMNRAKMITATEVIECADDIEAQQAALRLLDERSPYTVEVWDEARKVFHARGSDPEPEVPEAGDAVLPTDR